MNMTFAQFLAFLCTGGGAAIVFSFVSERIPAFQKLTSEQRSYAILAGSLVISVAAFAVVTFVPQGTLEAIAPWFAVVAGTFTTWLSTQGAHKVDPIA
jgi:hypothetical protein